MKTIQKYFPIIAVLLASTIVLSSCDKDDDTTPENPIENPKSIVEIAVADANFSTLVAALTKADLVTALNGDGPFTVFAPTNEAFEMLFDQLNVSGISDLSAEALTPILLYHVVSGNVLSSEVATGMVPTLNDAAEISINVSEMGVTLNESSTVLAVDVQGTNGVIHVIDKVLLP